MVWQAFVDPKIIDKWGGGPAKMSDKKGSKFFIWGGYIFGVNTKVIKHKILQQDWFSGDKWPKPSKVKFTFVDNGESTTVKLVHTDIPDKSLKSIDEGWKDYYLGPIKELLEK